MATVVKNYYLTTDHDFLTEALQRADLILSGFE